MQIGKAGWALKFSDTHTKMPLCEVMDLLTSIIVVIALQYIHIANHCAVHLTLHNVICQLYISTKLGGRKKKSSVDISGRNEMEKTKCIILWERNVKNSLAYYVKKRWHIYCYINVIYILCFLLQWQKKIWTSCCWLKGLSIIP